MNDQNIAYGDIRMRLSNTSTDCIDENFRKVMNELIERGMIVYDAKISISFKTGEELFDDLKKVVVTIDREDFDRITNHDYVKDPKRQEMLRFLSSYAYKLIPANRIDEFVNEFSELCGKLGTEWTFTSSDDFEVLDLNSYFRDHQLMYSIRRVVSSYQIQSRHITYY